MSTPDVIIVTVLEEDVAALRLMVGSVTRTDQQLAEAIALTMDAETGLVNLDKAAAKVWREEAGNLASLVDVSESGSSRKMSDLHKNALAMSAYYEKKVADTTAVVESIGRPRTRPIVRP